MKNKLLFTLLTFVALFTFPSENFGQVINLGTAKDFVLFTTVGAVTNTGTTHLTGNVGSNVGSSTGFGNVDGVMHDQDGASAAAGTDLATAYGQLNAAIPTLFPGFRKWCYIKCWCIFHSSANSSEFNFEFRRAK